MHCQTKKRPIYSNSIVIAAFSMNALSLILLGEIAQGCKQNMGYSKKRAISDIFYGNLKDTLKAYF